MPASVPRQKRDLASFQLPQDERIRWIAERRLHPLFLNICEAGHGVKPASADNPNLCLRQITLLLTVLQLPQYKGPRYLIVTTFMLQGVNVRVRGSVCTPRSVVVGGAHTGLAELVWSYIALS
jgi:hypothetical protein